MSLKNSILKRRSWTSIILATFTLGMVVTGLLLFALPYGATIAGVHNWFATAFLLLFIFHISNNGKTLLSYFKQKTGKRQTMLAVGISLSLVMGVLLYIPPFSSLIEFGYQLKKTKGVEEGSYNTLFTRTTETGIPISIDLRAGEYYESAPQPLFFGLSYRSTPQVAIWLENMKGNYLQTLYVTSKIASSDFRLASFSNTEKQRRPEALPYWSHKRGIMATDGLMVPLNQLGDLDGVTAATPSGHYDVSSIATTDNKQFRVLMEINRSYDFNDYYSQNRFPDDPVYSGTGSSGQPSIIYSATVNVDRHKRFYILETIGHGHHSGRDGKLYTDMTGIDTALQLIERVVVGIGENTEGSSSEYAKISNHE